MKCLFPDSLWQTKPHPPCVSWWLSASHGFWYGADFTVGASVEANANRGPCL